MKSFRPEVAKKQRVEEKEPEPCTQPDGVEIEQEKEDIQNELDILNCDDIEKLKTMFIKERLEFKGRMSSQKLEFQTNLLEQQSHNAVFREEIFKKISQTLEDEFNCCICNEIFIEVSFFFPFFNMGVKYLLAINH